MTIEIMKLITIISLTAGIISITWNIQRGNKSDTKNDAVEMANLNSKLDNVLIGISELKVKLNAIEIDQKNSRERIIILEQKTSTLFQKIDEINLHLNNKPDLSINQGKKI